MTFKATVTVALAAVTALVSVNTNATEYYHGNISLADGNAFPLDNSYIMVDSASSPTIMTVGRLFQDDVKAVTGKKPPLIHNRQSEGNPIIIGVIGHDSVIDRLIAEGRINVDSVSGRWEQFRVVTVDNPFENCDKALVIAGSDRRGAAYGTFAVSEAIGVSPWNWWADVPVKQRPSTFINADIVSTVPSVKYRGIFINDEDWGLKPWASNNYEKNLGDIGPRTYERVCELLLRLRGNMLAPAMHSCTGAFYSHTESKEVADRYGIIITTSHCEPLLINNAARSEWDKERDGEWNYATNKTVIRNKMDNRVREAANFENIYTMAMRGVHDEGLRGNLPIEKRVALLEEVIADQRDILGKHVDSNVDKVPQIFVPYKETLDVYNAGLRLPDDITIVWPDDNYGYWKHLSDANERSRSGGAGIYYHTSYLGAPHDYLWLCTIAPAFMYEELKKAYDFGARRYWLLNVGDIKPAEMTMQMFLDMAWNIDSFDFVKSNNYQAEMLAGIYGQESKAALQHLLDRYYRLAWSRKPEFMGWEREWDAPHLERIRPSEYSFDNYNDARRRLADYRALSDSADSIMNSLPACMRPSFFEFIGYPAMASCQMNRKFLMYQLNHEYAAKGEKSKANHAAMLAKEAFDSINALTHQYNHMLDGKWNGMMALAPGWVAKYQNMPDVKTFDDAGCEPVDFAVKPLQDTLENCMVIDLTKPASLSGDARIVAGLGYDWNVLQLGEARPGNTTGRSKATYTMPAIKADSIAVTVYTLPFFPLNDEIGTTYGISIDGGAENIAEYLPIEYGDEWKTNVLRNGVPHQATFAIDRHLDTHTIDLTGISAGTIVQKIIIDWGGLNPSYVGPSALQ